MERKLIRHIHSFRFAWEGIVHAWRTEINFRLHIMFSIFAVIGGILLGVEQGAMILIIIMITMGLSAELANTAIEELADFVTAEHRKEVKIVKDVSAGMMLIVSIGSLLVAIIVFIPYFIQLVY